MSEDYDFCEYCEGKRKKECCMTDKIEMPGNTWIKQCKFRDKNLKCIIYKKRFFLNPECHSVERGCMIGAFPKGCPYYDHFGGSTIQDESDMKTKFGERLWQPLD